MSGCTLVMDTSSSPLLIALEKDGKLYVSRRKGIKQERLLFAVLNSLLARAQTDLQHISRLLIIRGPGRFTGIRIALTFASMLQMLHHTQVCGVTLFEVLSRQAQASRAYQIWQAQHPSGVLAVVLHAFREEYFLQIFDNSSFGPQWLSREELLRRLAAYPQPLFICGTAQEFSPLDSLLNGAYTLAAYKDCRVRPQTLVAMSHEDKFAQNVLEPLYLKPARFELEGTK